MSANTKESPIETTISRMASSAHEAVDKVADATTHAADNLSERSQQIKAVEERWLDDLRNYVQANPVTAIGIAVAGGYLASRILGKR